MTDYQLRGFIFPGPARPTFVIPYFGLRTSNALFAQELDDQHNIAAFLDFDPARFESYPGPIPVHSVSIGSPGVMAYVDAEGALTAGAAQHVRQNLSRFGFSANGTDAFFATEAMAFRGDRRGLERAIDQAAHRFGDAAQGMMWKAREIGLRWGSSAAVRKSEDLLAQAIASLRVSRGERHWPSRFGDAWRELGPSEELLDEAMDWLRDGGLERQEAAGLFLLLVPRNSWRIHGRKRAVSQPPELLRMAHHWLETMRHHGWLWPQVWLRLYHNELYPAPDLEELALQYLDRAGTEGPGKGKRTTRSGWLKLWRALWQEGRAPDRLLRILESHANRFVGITEFGSVIRLLVELPEHEGWVRDLFIEWLAASPRKTREWAKAYIELLPFFGGDPKLEVVALDWLHEDGIRLNAWLDVWRYSQRFASEETLAELARNWLSHGFIGMRIWPDVLAELLGRDSIEHDKFLVEQASQWLLLDKKSPYRDAIEDFASISLDEMFPKQTRIFLSANHAVDAWRVAQVRNAVLLQDNLSLVPPVNEESWDSLKRAGPDAIQAMIDALLQLASVTLVLFGSETPERAWIDHEIKRSHILGLPIIAIDIHRLRGPDGREAVAGDNPLSRWQIERDGEQVFLSDIYPVYDWVVDDGARNIGNWIEDALMSTHVAA